jgi:hypothetical protein
VSNRTRFIVTFTPAPGSDAIRGLRAVLKIARRNFGLIAVDAYEREDAPDISNQIADAFAGLRHDVRRRVRINSELRTVAGAGGGRNESAPGKESNPMDMSKYAGSKFLRVADVREHGPFKVKIVGVEIGEYDKPDITFDDGSRLSCNATNCGLLIRAYGAESDDWLNKQLELYVGEVDYKGQPTETILVKPISPPLEKKTPVKPNKRGNAGGDLDDEIPF